MIPGNALSTSLAVAPVLPPDDLFDWCAPRADWEFGGVAVGDPTQGFQVYHWRIRAQGKDAVLDVPDQPSIVPVTLFTTEYPILEIGLSFDQNMNPSIAYYENSRAKFWYFDTDTQQRETLLLPEGSISPRCFLDDKRSTQTGSSDILLLYLRDEKLYYRQQRDRYLTERWLQDAPDAIGIARCGMTSGKRVQIELVYASDHPITEFCAFIDLVDVLPGQWYESNEITLNEWVTPKSELTITNGEYRYKWNQFAEWTDWRSTPSLVEPGSIIQLRGQAVNGFDAVRTVRIRIGDFQCNWSITTLDCAEAENFLFFTELFNAAPSSMVESESIAISNCVLPTDSISVIGGEYRLFYNDSWGDWTALSQPVGNPGKLIQLRLSASAEFNDRVCMTATVGGFSGEFCVTTRLEVLLVSFAGDPCVLSDGKDIDVQFTGGPCI